MPGRRGGYVVGDGGVWAEVGVRAAVWQLMLSAGGDLTTEFGRPPPCVRRSAILECFTTGACSVMRTVLIAVSFKHLPG